MRVIGMSFPPVLPEEIGTGGGGRILVPPGLGVTARLRATGASVAEALPAAFAEDDVVLLPGGPEPDDPWLGAARAAGGDVRWTAPLVEALDLPRGTVSRHASRRDPWPAGQGVAVYGAPDGAAPPALALFGAGRLLGGREPRTGPVGELWTGRRADEVLYVEPLGSASALPLAAAIRVMEILRAPQGCPWDREQTHESLLPYLLEEAAEAYDAVLERDLHAMTEELGDLLLQVLFHAQLGRESGEFALADVADALWQKLVRRHPHVFGDEHYASAQEFLPRWEELKAEEGTHRASELDGIPASLSSLAALEKAMRKIMRCGIAHLGEGSMSDFLEGRIAAGEDLEVQARRTLTSLKAHCNRAEAILGRRLSAAGAEEAASAWEMAQNE